MKKVLAIILTVIMVVSMGLTAFAVPNGFVSSPSGKPAPEIIEFKPHDETCTARLVITPYGERDDLSDFLKQLIERAYTTVTETDDITALNEAFAQYVAGKNINSQYLAVSELFDIHMEGCDYHEEHKHFDITLKAESLYRFVGLLHMNQDGVWEFIDNAEVTHGGDHLEFTVESFSPFAIIVDTSATPPVTGDNTMLNVYAVVMLVSAVALIVVLASGRKKQSV